jgi:hypothetical protein
MTQYGSDIGDTPDLHHVLDAWPTLPDPIKAGILPMVPAAAFT